MSTLGNTQCGEIPVIPNWKMTSKGIVYEENERVQIICQDGFQAQVHSLTCRQGKWSTDGLPLKQVCTRESSLV